MVFLISVVASFIATMIYGLYSDTSKKEPKKFILNCTIIGIILIPIVGLSQGTLHSHGLPPRARSL